MARTWSSTDIARTAHRVSALAECAECEDERDALLDSANVIHDLYQAFAHLTALHDRTRAELHRMRGQ